MAQRRDRPAIVRSGESLNIRLPDGSSLALPVAAAKAAGSSELCCFCGQSVVSSDAEAIRVAASWRESEIEREQSWRAHRGCLLERMHEHVAGAGPFFDE